MSALLLDVAPALVWPADETSLDEAVVGGKATGLARLTRAGARTAPWFAIPCAHFEDHLHAIGLSTTLGARLRAAAALGAADSTRRNTLTRIAEDASAAIRQAPLAPALVEHIRAALPALGPGRYAVRSSLVGEDSHSHSYAGQFDTLLGRGSLAEVIDAVACCWASAFSARALAYRIRAGVATELPAMAIVVQAMAEGDVSGVLFTAHPSDGPGSMLVTACWGLGDGIVGGQCDTDEYVWTRERGEIATRIADKDEQSVSDPSAASGARLEPVPHSRRRVRALESRQLDALCAEAARLVRQFGHELDIEWTLVREEFVFLQARPITARVVAAAGRRVVWDNSNIQESYCGVTTPLTFSFAAAAYASVYEQTMRVVGLPERTIAEYRPLLRTLLGFIRGRVYYNLNNWYAGLALLPSFGRNKADMERMMGVDEPVDFVVDDRPDLLTQFRRAPRMLATLARLLRRFATLRRDVSTFMRRFDAVYASVDRGRLHERSLSELLDLVAELRRDWIGHWHTPIVNDFAVMMWSGRLRRIVERAAPGRAPELTQLLLGWCGAESADPALELIRLARIAAQEPSLAQTIAREPIADIASEVATRHPRFAALVDDYVERFGDRCMGELKLETISLRQDRSFLYRALRRYLESAPAERDAGAQRTRATDAEGEVMATMGIFARRRFRHVLAATRRVVAARERMRLARTRMFGVHRDLYLAIGTRLHERRWLEAPRDVFYLTVDEIDAFAAGTSATTDLASLVRARRAELARFEQEEPPNRFETVGPIGDAVAFANVGVQRADDGTRTLLGTGCSSGSATGAVRIVRGPDDDFPARGAVLVARRTDPGWAPLFPSATAIVVERGSTLSHSAVLARELGIPAVVGIPHLLATLHDGEQVRVDGGAGSVERLELAP